MMVKIFLVGMILISCTVNAQTWEEWFQQKETQKKFLLQQIAALEVYYDYAKKGYDIATQGLATIQQIKNGDFNLHQEFFNSLRMVNPAIANWSRVSDIINLHIKIVKRVKEANDFLKETSEFTKQERDYCFGVLKKIAEGSVSDLDELILITTIDTFSMKDDERVKRIEVLYEGMRERYEFLMAFCNEIKLLSLQRMHDKSELNLSQKLD
jgi:hypothetical protein